MSGMDGDIKKDILDVRKVIEKSTSKVSLRDLEKKGFRKVKVLRAGDINQLIYKAVQTVLAKQPALGMGEAEREQVLAEAKAEYERQTKQLQQLQETQDRIEAEKATIEQKAREIEEAKKRLEQKVGELNQQLVGERNRMQAEKAEFAKEKEKLEREKQNLYEKGFDAVNRQQQQVQELQAKLDAAEARASGGVAREQFEQLQTEARERLAQYQTKIDDLERKLKVAQQDAELGANSAAARLKGTQQALEEAEARVSSLQQRLAELEGEVGRYRSKANGYDEATGRASKLAEKTGELEAELEKTKAQLATAQAAANEPKGDPAEVQHLREQLAAAQAQIAASTTQTSEMFGALMGAIKDVQRQPVAAAAAGPSVDLDKQLKALSQNLTDQIRKYAGSGFKGGASDSGEIDVGALMARNAETTKLETNIKDVGVKEQSAAGVKDKLSKLRSMRGGGNK